MHYVYILFSQSLQRYYCGETAHLENRIQRHNQGRSKATKAGVPWILVKSFEVENRIEARKLEKTIHGRGIQRFLKEI